MQIGAGSLICQDISIRPAYGLQKVPRPPTVAFSLMSYVKSYLVHPPIVSSAFGESMNISM